MSKVVKETPGRSARAEASVWIVRLQGDDRTPELEEGLREWLAAHPDNAREFEYLTDIWEMGGAITADGLPRMRSWGPSHAYHQWAIAAAVLAVVGIGLFKGVGPWTDPSFSTGHGEQRLVRLDDGSRISMNSDTRLNIEFGDTERRISLKKGEAYFEVVKDVNRPFVVQAGKRRVTALGTTFVVRHDASRTDVTLVEGKVAVKSFGDELPAPGTKPGGESREIILVPGERLRLVARTRAKLDSPRIEAVTAWRRGEVLLNGTPLPEAISEMNRYDDRQISIDDPALAAVRVSGVYRTGDSVGFARAVADLHGLKFTQKGEWIHLQSQVP